MKKAKNRPAVDTAATLAVSRLPLGAQNLLPHIRTARPSSRTSQTSAVTANTSSSYSPSKNNMASSSEGAANDITSTSDDKSTTPDNETTMSIAEGKLERQNKRIQEAEAALTAPLPIERERQPSRKGKWKPFDYTAGSTSTTPAEGPEPLRLNPFRDSSRASSLNRSLSSLSQRTTNTVASEAERQDAAGGPGAGFQLYTRKSRRTAEHLGVYEENPEEKQSTVEATFDKREIYEVFGNALPGPDFIEQNIGYKNGQLQFAQHPNGDVSAHQWSSSRYMWENIGQFSNIRKKVEGQLAVDRLKGETAYQTVQRNTLAYFRTIAKQREAAVMGTSFGAKEIQALMSDLRLAQEVPTAPKNMRPVSVESQPPVALRQDSVVQFTPSTSTTRSQSTILQPSAPTFRYGSMGHSSFAPTLQVSRAPVGGETHRPSQPFPVTYRPYTGGDFVPASSLRHEDPFYSSTMPPPTFQTPQYTSPAPKPPGGVTYNSFGAPVASADYSQPAIPIANMAAVHRSPEAARRMGNENSIVSAAAPLLQKVVTPLTNVNRTAMRNQLIKLGDQAKERSLSQSSFRTVMFDPLRNEDMTRSKTASEDPASQYDSPALKRSGRQHSTDSQVSPRTTTEFTVPRKMIVPVIPLRPDLGATTLDGKVTSKPASLVAPIGTPASVQKPTTQTLTGPFFPADEKQGSVTTRKPRHTELSDWWNSGNKFLRQEEFCKRVEDSWLKGINTTPTRTSGGRFTVASGSAPPLTSSNQQRMTMTRLLVPVLENLSSYVQGPVEKRRDYFSQWSKPPEWCIDRSPEGNQSFYDKSWGQPPARIGRDPRYQSGPVGFTPARPPVRFGDFSSPQRMGSMTNLVVGAGLDRRFAFRPQMM